MDPAKLNKCSYRQQRTRPRRHVSFSMCANHSFRNLVDTTVPCPKTHVPFGSQIPSDVRHESNSYRPGSCNRSYCISGNSGGGGGSSSGGSIKNGSSSRSVEVSLQPPVHISQFPLPPQTTNGDNVPQCSHQHRNVSSYSLLPSPPLPCPSPPAINNLPASHAGYATHLPYIQHNFCPGVVAAANNTRNVSEVSTVTATATTAVSPPASLFGSWQQQQQQQYANIVPNICSCYSEMIRYFEMNKSVSYDMATMPPSLLYPMPQLIPMVPPLLLFPTLLQSQGITNIPPPPSQPPSLAPTLTHHSNSSSSAVSTAGKEEVHLLSAPLTKPSSTITTTTTTSKHLTSADNKTEPLKAVSEKKFRRRLDWLFKAHCIDVVTHPTISSNTDVIVATAATAAAAAAAAAAAEGTADVAPKQKQQQQESQAKNHVVGVVTSLSGSSTKTTHGRSHSLAQPLKHHQPQQQTTTTAATQEGIGSRTNRLPFVEGCKHLSYRRLRFKKGYGYYCCNHCGMRWKLLNQKLSSAVMTTQSPGIVHPSPSPITHNQIPPL